MTEVVSMIIGAVAALVAVQTVRLTRRQLDTNTTAPVRAGQRDLRREVRADVVALRALVAEADQAAKNRERLPSVRPAYMKYLGWMEGDRFTDREVPRALAEALVPLTSWWATHLAYLTALQGGDPTDVAHRAVALSAEGRSAEVGLYRVIEVLNALDKQP